jgi:hypothetical protein
MRALWKGNIGFGLVNIPVSLFPATRHEELKFHLLRRTIGPAFSAFGWRVLLESSVTGTPRCVPLQQKARLGDARLQAKLVNSKGVNAQTIKKWIRKARTEGNTESQ